MKYHFRTREISRFETVRLILLLIVEEGETFINTEENSGKTVNLDMLVKFFENGKIIESVELSNENSKVAIGNGSGPHVHIKINSPVVSRLHASLFYQDDTVFIQDNNSSNGTFVNNYRIQAQSQVRLKPGDVVKFAQNTNIEAQLYDTDKRENEVSVSLSKLFEGKKELIIGRNPDCDYRLDSPTVSRRHCMLKNIDKRIVIKDLESTNGTYVNGQKIKGEVDINESDVILIGTYKFSVGKGFKDIKDEAAVQIINLEKKFSENKIGFESISISIPNRAMVAIMGPSGCGKSTLLKTLTGTLLATGGEIFIHGLNFITYYDYIKSHIGYVPQDDIIHKDLTVSECLYYTSKLRLANMDDAAIFKKIDKILYQLHIYDTRDQLVHSLSGGQRKRVCIAVELLVDPLILFLDEPTSPLDPQSVEDFLKILRELTKQGTTIVMVTHKPGDLEYIDKVLFLAKGGIPVFYGNVDQHLTYFTVSRTVDIYSILSDNGSKSIKEYKDKNVAASKQTSSSSSHQSLASKSGINILSQTYWLTKRCLRTKLNDKVNTGLLLFQAPVIAVLISIIFVNITLPVLFLMSITAIWLGTNNSAREIVNEQPIYQRERLYNLNLFAYITSKMLVFLLLGLVQSFLFVTFLYFKFRGNTLALNNPLYIFLWVTGLTFCSSLLGLCISGLAKNNEQVISTIPLILIPQIMLAGVITRVNNIAVEMISYLTVARWGTEGFTKLQKNIMVESSGKRVTTPASYVSDASAVIAHQYHEKYYSHSIFKDWTSTFKLDITMLVVMCMVLLTTLVICLKRKDTI